jgi:glutamate-1-semialdehyde aminotransferase
MSLEKSKSLLERAYKVIPNASQTFSKSPNQWAGTVSPNFLARGEGAWVWDVDGNRYLDYLMALGPIVLGYNDPVVIKAVTEQIQDGAIFSQMHPLEVEVSEMLCELIPCAEMVRFGKNGSDATSAAIRAARAYTRRDHVVMCGYHGWHDWCIGTTTRDAGIPVAVKALSHTFPYNNLGALEELFNKYQDQIACVMMEPIGVEKPADDYLAGVKALCEKHGALLVFDEIVNGFRVSLGGAQAHYGVTPHLACFGKAMGNGLPISAVVGQRPYMNMFNEVFFSGTFGGDAVALAACKATIKRIQTDNVIEHLWQTGDRLLALLNELIDKYALGNSIKLLGLPVRSVLAFPRPEEKDMLLRRSFFMQECIKRGLLYFCSHIPCAAHGDVELEFTEKVFREVFPLFAEAEQHNDFASRLEGPPIQAIFRRP